MFPCISWEELSFTFRPEKNIMFSGKKNTFFPDNTRKIVCRRDPSWKDHLFRKFEGNIIFPCIFEERPSFIFRLRCKIIFSRKEILSFPIMQERLYSSAIFLERPSFQDVWEKKIWFSVQCQYENVALQPQRNVCQTQLQRCEITITHLRTRYVDYARDPGKDNIIIIVRKHATPANDKYHDLPYYVSRIQRRKRYVKLRWFDQHYPDHEVIVEIENPSSI